MIVLFDVDFSLAFQVVNVGGFACHVIFLSRMFSDLKRQVLTFD
ncbi:hypothetical protein AU106_gp228 [Sinorhizobium phage phiM9]|uniref:Uncharacterized protein n=1 Tax=Sinorhizobium phage phiM9 TaxID=1636182 RepID=A0A0F6THB0_9CAUD|nr:hypothetical protein AU106_gp228 [Sinorhizobium phage phiM9]AKE44859.1 hypothetical protein Sm_phiM9_232 [Sinorhizobium phage phiM9]